MLFIEQLTQGVSSYAAELDAKLQPVAPAWPIDQIARMDRLILRIGLYELEHAQDVPPKVVINEAVELAKAFEAITQQICKWRAWHAAQIERRISESNASTKARPRAKKLVNRRPVINEAVHETTAGGVILGAPSRPAGALAIRDAKNRWTIPKGRRTRRRAKETAAREITEETGLTDIKMMNWLGKVNFRYRRSHTLVLMTMHIS